MCETRRYHAFWRPGFLHRMGQRGAPPRRVSVQGTRTGALLAKLPPIKRLARRLLSLACAKGRARERKLEVSFCHRSAIARGVLASVATLLCAGALAAGKGPEKEQLKLGFIKLT